MKLLNKPIDAIVTFDEKGNPTPLRIKIKNDNDEEFTVMQVTKILHSEKQKFGNMYYYIFRCRTQQDNYIKDFELKFEISSCKWFLYKM